MKLDYLFLDFSILLNKLVFSSKIGTCQALKNNINTHIMYIVAMCYDSTCLIVHIIVAPFGLELVFCPFVDSPF
jgi:hypothetical protein